MKFNAGIAAAIVLSFAVAGLAACEKGPAERAGEKIDNAAKKVGDKVEDAGDKIKDAAKDATK
jgi:hyperosmotically inducible protein